MLRRHCRRDLSHCAGKSGIKLNFRQGKECWADFADSLRMLVDPDLENTCNTKEQLALNHFVSQIENGQVAFSVRQKHPKNSGRSCEHNTGNGGVHWHEDNQQHGGSGRCQAHMQVFKWGGAVIWLKRPISHMMKYTVLFNHVSTSISIHIICASATLPSCYSNR